jgi:hypothetical protein
MMNGTGSAPNGASHPPVDATRAAVVQIDKGIPMPNPERVRGAAPKYPWRTMEVGDSFILREYAGRDSTTRASAQIDYAKKSTGRQFAQRKVEENGKIFIRVWRVS